MALSYNPNSLFNSCLNCYVNALINNSISVNDFQETLLLPSKILITLYLKMSEKIGMIKLLHEQLSDLELFRRFLRQPSIRQDLFKCASRMPVGGKYLAIHLKERFIMKYTVGSEFKDSLFWDSPETKISPKIFTDDFDIEAVQFGLILGSFLYDAGWWIESTAILACVSDRLENCSPEQSTLLLRLDCFQKLLRAEAGLCNFNTAAHYLKGIEQILTILGPEKIPPDLLALIYTQMSTYYYARSEYTPSLQYGTMALSQIKENTEPEIIIDVLRQTAKACVVKCEFNKAYLLIIETVKRAKLFFGSEHHKYFEVLIDYGFFLWNVDAITTSIQVFEEALNNKVKIFGGNNFQIAIAHQHLSYAYYIHEYLSNCFSLARHHVELSISIFQDLIPKDHMILVSSKRIKALILERSYFNRINDGILDECNGLYKFCLEHSLNAFGENNVQTAKLYRNLGRLYRTMKKFNEAEKFQKKAIAILTDLLGPNDYEVGLAIGHLAALYNYSMGKLRAAEKLYLRCIQITYHHFGTSFSGLKFSYLGLCHIYNILDDRDKFNEYTRILENWSTLTSKNNWNSEMTTSPKSFQKRSIDEIIKTFNEMEPQVTCL